MRQDGIKTSLIFRHLGSLYREEQNQEPPFTYMDVYNSISPHSFDRALDSTGYIQHLQRRKDEEGLYFNWISDEDGTMTKAFNVYKDAVKVFSDGCRPILFDTKHGTNRYGLRLGCFTTVGRDGGTVLLGTTLLSHEDQESFEWAFLQFREALGGQPHCIFTDGDKAMANAISVTLPETKHFLCIWHLSQNIIKNTKGNDVMFLL
jgi:zinc finger SWIM domain-containing protein 3